ncbi:MAG: TlyA family RNA methyltransferase [Flexilinea sp.]|nr:TlyA family RNA methyltransferase [Flexilinea sp.]
MAKERLDVMMQNRGLAESRTLAQKLIMAGEVRVNGNMIIKPSQQFQDDVEITVEKGPQFVSRGGEKLLGALEAFDLLDVHGAVCADVGASTGGFTDCLLQHGASKVYAIDVGYGILHWKMRNDPRVISMEKTNARDVKLLPERIELAVCDASFISLRILLPVISGWFRDEPGRLITLIKPQFEAGKEEAAKGAGVIRDPNVHRSVLENVLQSAIEFGYECRGLVKSPLLGPKGNVEFLADLRYPGGNFDVQRLIINCMKESGRQS